MTLRIAIVTNAKTPYRSLQFTELATIPDCSLQVFYLNKDLSQRNWEVKPIQNVPEKGLSGIKLTRFIGWFNLGLRKIVTKNDLIVIGGYYQPSYVLLSVFARLCNKPYVLIFDGISPVRIAKKELLLKFLLKKWVISGSAAIFANGTVSENYFVDRFNYAQNRIYNQYLTVDVESIFRLSPQKSELRARLRKRYNIKPNMKVLIFSGRLIKVKNVTSIVDAISLSLDPSDYCLLILGDGPEKDNILGNALAKNVRVIVTGFISQQLELFKHYFIGDVLILPSFNDVWGLVINEAMAAGLPIIASSQCGAYLDLVKDNENGYVVEPNDSGHLLQAMQRIFSDSNLVAFGRKSRELIKEWSFKSSRENFRRLLADLNLR